MKICRRKKRKFCVEIVRSRKEEKRFFFIFSFCLEDVFTLDFATFDRNAQPSDEPFDRQVFRTTEKFAAARLSQDFLLRLGDAHQFGSRFSLRLSETVEESNGRPSRRSRSDESRKRFGATRNSTFQLRVFLEEFQEQIRVSTQNLIERLLSDPKMVDRIVSFFDSILKDPTSRESLANFLEKISRDEKIQENLSTLAEKILFNLMKNPETEVQLGRVLRRAVGQSENKEALHLLLQQFVEQEKTKILLKETAQNAIEQVLRSENFQRTASQFAQAVLSDEKLKNQSADFLWETAKNAVKPRIFSK